MQIAGISFIQCLYTAFGRGLIACLAWEVKMIFLMLFWFWSALVNLSMCCRCCAQMSKMPTSPAPSCCMKSMTGIYFWVDVCISSSSLAGGEDIPNIQVVSEWWLPHHVHQYLQKAANSNRDLAFARMALWLARWQFALCCLFTAVLTVGLQS